MARRRRGSLRSGGTKVIGRIIENAEHLAEHPELAAPRCDGRCPLFCTFKRARKRVSKVHKHRDDEDKLKKLGKRFHDIGKAYAAACRLALAGEDKLEYLQNVNTPKGKIPIAPWSKAPPACHVGMQHHHDPRLRMMMVVPFVDEGDVVYVTEAGLVCAHDASPPEETLERILSDLGLPTDARGEITDPAWKDGEPPRDRPVLVVSWPAAGLELELAPRGDRNVLATLQRHMVAPGALAHFDVHVKLPPLGGTEGQGHETITLPEPVLRRYVGGQLSDDGLVQEAHEARAARLKARDEPLVVYGGEVHAPPFQDLLDELGPGPPVDVMLEAALNHLDRPVVLKKGTPVELLHARWADHGHAALTAVLDEDGQELYDPAANPSDLERLMRKVNKRVSRQRVARELPTYDHVPEPADLADDVRRALLYGGKSEAQQLLNQPPSRSHQAMALALVHVLDLPSPAWTIEPRERETAEHLEPYALQAMQAKGEDYHEALQTLLAATGSTAELERVDG